MEAEETQVGEEMEIAGGKEKGKGKALDGAATEKKEEGDEAALNAAVEGLKQLVVKQQESTRRQLERAVKVGGSGGGVGVGAGPGAGAGGRKAGGLRKLFQFARW